MDSNKKSDEKKDLDLWADKKLFDEDNDALSKSLAYKNKTTAAAYFAGYGPITSYSKQITFLTIPSKDDKEVEHTPKFTFNNKKFMEEILKFFYEKMTEVKE